MRESVKTERIHLPSDAMETWLGSQSPKRFPTARHRTPPQDSLEAWLEARVEKAKKAMEPGA